MNETGTEINNELKEKFTYEKANRFLNPLMQIKSKFNQILISEGFSEVRSPCHIENSFWDSTFIWFEFEETEFQLKYPARSKSIEENYPDFYHTLTNLHKQTWTNDFMFEFTDEETSLNYMRNFTTGIYYKALYKYSVEYKLKGNELVPKKIF